MKLGWLVVALAACTQGKKQDGAGVASGSATAGSGSAIAAPNECEIAGLYRLRFHSNGTDGWWLRLKIQKGKAEVATPAEMLGLDAGPIDMKVGASCALTLTKHTKQAGDITIVLAVDAKGVVTGTLTRTENADDKAQPTSPISGMRETAPPKLPACVHPGLFDIKYDAVKPKWKLDGTPFGGKTKGACKMLVESYPVKLRLDALGDQILVDESSDAKPLDQGFGRGKVTRTGECAITLSIELQDFTITDAVIVLDGDKLTGTAKKAHVQMFEDGEAGENMWSCDSADAQVTGTRVGD
jgi:hypothetical protein